MEIKINRENPGIHGGHVFWPVTPPVYLCGSGSAVLLWAFIFCSVPIWGLETVQLGVHVGSSALCGHWLYSNITE